MGVWEWIYSATDAVKPNVTPATKICRESYGFCRDSAASATSTVTSKARDLHLYLSDDQVRDNLSRFAKNVSKHGALYIARSYGGGPIIDIVSRSVQENMANSHKERMQENRADPHKKRIDELEAKLGKLEKELSSKKTIEQLEIQKVILSSESQDEVSFSAIMNQRPEDVLNVFMKQQFMGTKLFDNLIIPIDVGSNRKDQAVSSIQG